MITNELIKQYTTELANTLIQKNHDYGNSVHEQFKEYGLSSILVRLDDKMRRLKNLRTLTPQVAEESLKDTLKDLSGYALLGLMCLVLEEQKKPMDLDDISAEATLDVAKREPTKYFNLGARLVPLTENWMKLEDVKQQIKPNKPPYFDQDDQH